MRTLASLLSIVVLVVSAEPLQAQKTAHARDRTRHLDLEVEPLAYAFGGAGGHVAY